MSAATAPLRGPWRSVAFRIALNYGLLTLFFMAVLLSIVYFQTVVGQRHHIDRQITLASQRLVARFVQGGAEALTEQIAINLADGVDSDSEVYLLQDSSGQRVAGNLPAAAHWRSVGDAISSQDTTRGGQRVRLRVVARALDDGKLLVVGRDLRDQRQVELAVGRAILAAALVALLLVIVGAYLFRLDIETRVAGIRRTAARIEAGELHQRIPGADQGDEFAGLSQDINRMLDRIEDLMAGVRHVSNTIAHNLRTPLSRVLLRLRQAQRPGTPLEEMHEAAQTAVREIEDLTVVFDKLMQIAEAESGARRHGFAPLALDDIATGVVELYDALAEAQGATLTLATDDAAVARGDRDLLASALANLVDNALKYGGSAGLPAAVQVRVERWGEVSRIIVRDNGPGIPAAEHARIGTRFHRLPGDPARPVPGYGLGLASVMAIVHLHGGRVLLADAAPGLVMTVELPALPG
ncbi:HAMP domain-containing sensor histidine kinase [Xylophilus sp. GW821-FHT01B05]